MSTQYVHIIGIAPRCGSNYLYKLLSLHPDVVPGKILGEDNLLIHAHLLSEYAEKLSKSWRKNWGNDNLDVAAALGKGLEQMIYPANDEKSIIIKTPLTTGLPHLFTLFPEHKVILVVRNGTDVAESYVRTFGGVIEDIARVWRTGAREIMSFTKANPLSRNVHLVYYEQLVKQTADEMNKVCTFLGLEFESYPQKDATSLGVVGSSELAKEGGKVHWRNEVEMPVEFDPTSRSNKWTRWQKIRFNSFAGGQMLILGYGTGQNTFHKFLFPFCKLNYVLIRLWRRITRLLRRNVYLLVYW